MTTAALLPDPLSTGPFRTATAAAFGVTPRMLAGRRFVRLFRDVYVLRALAGEPWVRPAGALLLAPHGALGHVTAARAWDLPAPAVRPGRPEPVHLVVPPGTSVPRRPGLTIHEVGLPARDVAERDGRPVTVPGRLLADVAADWALADLVACGDAALARGLVDHPDLCARLSRGCGRRGITALRRAVPLLDGTAPSPAASRLRVLVVVAGMPQPVHVDVDRLGWPEQGVLLEADEHDLWLRPDVLVTRTWDLLRAHGWCPARPRPATHEALAALGVFRTPPRWDEPPR